MAESNELCMNCGLTYEGHIGNTGCLHPCWKPSGKYNMDEKSIHPMTARELPDSYSGHSCSYYCDHPACVKAQRDQMRDAMFAESEAAPRVSEGMVKFLLGEGTLDGVWFGDKHPTERGLCWWRKHFRTEADHSARVADLEHRLANCDADLFAMQEAKQAAERRVAEVKALLLDCYSVRQQWPHSAETDAIWIRVAELVKEQPA